MAIIDEKSDIENIIELGFIGSKPMKTIYLIAKYYFSVGKNKVQVRNEIESFLKNNYKKYNKIKWDDRLDEIVNQLSKKICKMVYVDKVSITDKELNKINTLPNEKLKRMAFVILFRAKITMKKYGKEDIWLSDSIGYITKLAKVYGKTEEKMLMMSKLQDYGFIKAGNSLKHFSYHILFIEDGVDLITFDNIVCDSDIIMGFFKHNGEDVSICTECGKFFKTRINTTVCNDCSYNNQKEHSKKYKRKVRK